MVVIKYILPSIGLAHGVFAMTYFLIWPTLQRVYFGIPQFWLEFDTGRGVSLFCYLMGAFVSAVASGFWFYDNTPRKNYY